MNLQEQIKKHIASHPEPKRSEIQALHDIIQRVDPACKLWFLDGKNEDGKVVSNPNIGSYVGVNGAAELGISNLTTYGYPNIVYQTGPFVALTQMGDPQNDFQTYIGMGLLNTVSFSKAATS